jgi:hypothetical protein
MIEVVRIYIVRSLGHAVTGNSSKTGEYSRAGKEQYKWLEVDSYEQFHGDSQLFEVILTNPNKVFTSYVASSPFFLSAYQPLENRFHD